VKCARVLALKVLKKNAKAVRRNFSSNRLDSVLALVTVPGVLGERPFHHGRIDAFEMEGASATIATDQVTVTTAGSTVVIVFLLSHRSALFDIARIFHERLMDGGRDEGMKDGGKFQ
jgi:hypothetical protein